MLESGCPTLVLVNSRVLFLGWDTIDPVPACAACLFLGESLAAAERPEFAGSSVTKAWGYLNALGCRLWLFSDCPASAMGRGNREKMHRWGQEP